MDLSISKGVQQITSRSYVGLSSDQALNELTALGFKVLNTFAYSDSVPAGAVISQSPDTTTSQDMGSSIRLIISQGSEFVFIPNVYALTQHDATVALENSQLQVIVRKIGTKIVKKVTNISPNAGTKVKRNSPVVITLG